MVTAAAERAPEQEVLEISPKMWEALYLKKQLETYASYREMVSGRGGLPEEYQQLKEKWQADKKKIEEFRSQLPEELFDPENPDSYLNINSSQEVINNKLEELALELQVNIDDINTNIEFVEEEAEETAPTQPEPKENTGWTPKGIWGHKDPATMTLEEKQAMLKKAHYSGPLATAYWENEIKNHHEQPDREEAEKTRNRVQELEAEVAKLKNQITELQSKGENESEVEMDQQLVEDAEEELGEKKKGIGERFKNGVKSFFDRFKSKPEEEKPAEPVTEKEKISEEEREKKIEALKEEIQRLRDERYRKSREVGVIEQTKIEEEYNQKIKELENEIKELEKSGPKKIDRKGVVGFLWERTKGMVGFGWWEAHQAEKFRLGTKETGQDLNAQSELLQQEEGLILDPNEAWKEAQQIESQRAKEEKDWVENQGADPAEARKLAVEFLSAKISSQKRKENQIMEDVMVASALRKLEDKLKTKSWVQEYMAANGGKVITPEKMQEVEKRIREEIGKMRQGQMKKDFVDFVKLSRNSLDKRWWSRYIYAGLDAVLAGLFFKWIVSRGVEKAVAGKASGGAAKEVLEIGMKDTVWGETKRFLVQHGLSNPTNNDILKYAKMVAQDSGVTVPDWGIAGHILDTQMPAGYLLKFGRVAAELTKLAV